MRRGKGVYAVIEWRQPASFGLLEDCGQGRTDIDRDEDGDYWEDCQGMSRRVHPVGRPGLFDLGKFNFDL